MKKLTREDVYKIAGERHIQIDDPVADIIIERFENSDYTNTWEVIVKDLLYDLLING